MSASRIRAGGRWTSVLAVDHAAILCFAALSSAQVSFVETGPYPLPPDPTIQHVVDLDLDGHLDLIVRPHLTTLLYFSFGDGLGAFTLSPTPLDVGFAASSIATGDLDGDLDPDLVVASLGSPLVVHYENLGGGFALVQTIDPGSLPTYLLLEDFTGNGIRDLAVLRGAGPMTAPALSLYVNNGAGVFGAPSHFPVGNNPIYAEAVRLNGDAQLDVVVAAAGVQLQDLGEVSVLIANGPASFAPTISTGTNHPVHFAVADFAGGPDLDLALVDATAAFGCGLAGQIWIGNGAGGFTAGQVVDFPCGPFSMRAADFDLDGVTDLLLTDGGDFIPAANFFQVAQRNALGNLEVGMATFGGTAYSLAHPAMGDFNEDGRVDVAMGGLFMGSGLSVFLAQGGTPPLVFERGDTNEDGTFNIADPIRLLAFLFVAGTDPMTCPDSGDGNDDGLLNIADAVYILSAIFTSPSPPPPAPFPTCGVDPTPDALPECDHQPGGC